MDLDQYASPAFGVTAVVLFTTLLAVYLRNKNRKLPPGPWGLPLLGYYPFVSNQTHLYFVGLAKRYGDVFSFRTVGGKLVVVLNGFKTIKDVLVNRADEFIGRPKGSNIITWLSDGIGITQEDGPVWKEQRRFFLQTAKTFGFGKVEMENDMLDTIRNLMNDLRDQNGKPVEIILHFAHMTSTIACKILFSKKFSKGDPTFKDIVDGMHDVATTFQGKMNLMTGPLFELIMNYSPKFSAARRGKSQLMKAVKILVDEHMKSFDPDHPKDYVDAYLKQMEDLKKAGKLESSSFTMERLIGNSANLVLESTESVSFAICLLLSLLSKQPEAQKVAQKELDAVVGTERQPSWRDRPNLRYIEALIQELFRLAAPFVVTTQYSNYEETTISGYRIPRRSIIMSNLYSINMDPDIFPDPEKFDPYRFLSPDGQKLKKEGPYPFGLGKRSCIGESLSQMEVYLVITSLLQKFNIRPGDDEGTLRFLPREE